MQCQVSDTFLTLGDAGIHSFPDAWSNKMRVKRENIYSLLHNFTLQPTLMTIFTVAWLKQMTQLGSNKLESWTL